MYNSPFKNSRFLSAEVGFINILRLFHSSVLAQMRGKREEMYTTLSLHLAQTWCETNKESLKNQPHVSHILLRGASIHDVCKIARILKIYSVIEL